MIVATYRRLNSVSPAHDTTDRLEKIGAQAIALLLENSSCLSILNLAFCKASPADISTILNPVGGTGPLACSTQNTL
jgi:hypothetical protein